MLGGMGAAAPVSPNSTFYCGNANVPFKGRTVGSFLICMAVLLISCGLLILGWAVKSFFNVHKCVKHTLTSIMCISCLVSLLLIGLALFGVLPYVIFSFGENSSGVYMHCNSGFLVMYYWLFAEAVIICLLTIIAIIVGIFAVIVKCIQDF